MTRTRTRTPDPADPVTTPEGYPPVRPVLRDHFLRWMSVYLVVGTLLTLAGIGWTIAELRRQADELALMKRMIATEGD